MISSFTTMDCGSLLPLSFASLLANHIPDSTAGCGNRAAAGCRSPWALPDPS